MAKRKLRFSSLSLTTSLLVAQLYFSGSVLAAGNDVSRFFGDGSYESESSDAEQANNENVEIVDNSNASQHSLLAEDNESLEHNLLAEKEPPKTTDIQPIRDIAIQKFPENTIKVSSKDSSSEEAKAYSMQNDLQGFILKSQYFVGGNERAGLNQQQITALNMLNAALMQIGVEALSDMSTQNSLGQLNRTIGCINTINNSKLSDVAQNLILKYTTEVDIGRIVNQSQKVGSGFKSNCF